MRKHSLLICLLLTLSAVCARAQEQQPIAGTVEVIEISGISEERLSQPLRDDLQKLRGQAYDAEVARQFADRIQTELPEYVAASRTVAGNQAGQVRLVFVVARISDSDALGENINARYPVESVELEGVPRTQVSDSLWNEMQKMVGQPMNNDEAERLRKALQDELGSRYTVARTVKRSQRPRQLSIKFVVTKLPLLQWRTLPSFAAYHPKQGISAFANDNLNAGWSTDRGSFSMSISPGFGTDGDSLVERYKGLRLGLTTGPLVTEHLGFRVDLSTFGTQWKSQTLRAAEQTPGDSEIYRRRRAIAPTLGFAINQSLYVSAGFEATELEMQFPQIHWESVRLGTGAVHYQRTVKFGEKSHEVTADYTVRTAARSVESEFVYTRHLWEGGYVFRDDKNVVKLGFMGGRITGDAPLFERFSIGNTVTARGWNKFDISPLGASRMVHGSIEAGRVVRLFYDAGAVWNASEPVHVRHSFGLNVDPWKDDRVNGIIAAAVRNSRLELSIMVRANF